MQRLLLIRHAKAAAFGREPGDHARPLSDKGHSHAEALGVLLREAHWVPDLAIVSNALRTVQTWEDMSRNFEDRPVHYAEALYLASLKTLMAQLISGAQDGKTLALIGHNPGISLLADHLIAEGFDHDSRAEHALALGFKTGWAAAFEMREEGPGLAQLFDPRGTAAVSSSFG